MFTASACLCGQRVARAAQGSDYYLSLTLHVPLCGPSPGEGTWPQHQWSHRLCDSKLILSTAQDGFQYASAHSPDQIQEIPILSSLLPSGQYWGGPECNFPSLGQMAIYLPF